MLQSLPSVFNIAKTFLCQFADVRQGDLFAVIISATEAGKKSAGKPRDESMIDKKHELEKRLENVKGALGAPSKKPPKKGLKLTTAVATHAVS